VTDPSDQKGGITVAAHRSRAGGALAALLAVVALGAAACGSDDKSTGSSGGGGAKTAKLAFVYPTTETNFAQEMALGAKAAAGQINGVKLTESAPANVDGPKQVQLFQTAARTSKDGIAMMSLTPDLFLRPLLTASRQGVPLVAVDVPPPKGAESAVKLLIGNSNVEIGQDLAKAVVGKIPKDAKGEILIGTDTPGLPVLEQRNQGFQEIIKKERPGATFRVFDAKQSPTDNYNTWSAQVKAHPHALAYVGPGSQAAVSLSRIERRTGKRYVVGACDLDAVALEGVRDGLVTALISPEHWLKSYIAISLMADAAQNGKDLPQGVWNSGALTVDKDNIADIIARQKSPASRATWFKDEAAKQLANPDQYLSPMPTG
jgi:ribose transport system substrate-binding protein